MVKNKTSLLCDIGSLIISILLAEGVGFIATAFIKGSNIYYNLLKKPAFAPPSWLFGIIWPILYLLMAAAAYFIWIKRKEGVNIGSYLFLYIFQLVLNFIWPIIFFRLNLYGIAFIELVILIIIVILTTIQFFKLEKLSGFLMLPYILWIIFAAVLNYSIWLLNEA